MATTTQHEVVATHLRSLLISDDFLEKVTGEALLAVLTQSRNVADTCEIALQEQLAGDQEVQRFLAGTEWVDAERVS